MVRFSLHIARLFFCLCLLVSAFIALSIPSHAATTSVHKHHPRAKDTAQILPRPLRKGQHGTGLHASAPANTTSYYESSTNPGTLQSQGCAAARGPAGIVVIDFGEPDSSGGVFGTYDFGGNFDSDNAIFHAAANFVYGAWNCRTSSTNLAVAIGTSNDNTALSSDSATWYAAGQAWGNMVNNEQSYIANNGYNNVIGAYAADDIETEWGTFTQSSSFVNGYNNTSTRLFFDYGDDTPGYWTDYQVWYVAYGAAASLPLPEIYYNANANEWEGISAWACSNEGGAMVIRGVMTESPYGNSPSQGWYDMYNAEGTNGCTASAQSSLIFSTNI